MTLDQAQELELRLADGLASGVERDAAAAAGVDASGMARVRSVVADALTPPPLELHGAGAFADAVLAAAGLADEGLGEAVRGALAPGPTPAIARSVLAKTHPGHVGAPELRRVLGAPCEPGLVPAVMAGIGGDPEDVGPVLKAALHSPASPGLTGSVMEALGVGEDSPELGPALAADDAPPLADAVMARLAAGESLADLRGAVAGAAGTPPALWEGVAARIGGAKAEPGPGPAGATSDSVGTVVDLDARRRSWVPLAGIAAAAAAAVVAVIGMPTERASDGHGDLATHIHLESGHADIEEISAGPEAMVQVLQFEDDAPTIIFIDELEEPGGPEGEEGVSL